MSVENVCNGITHSLPSLEVVKKVDNSSIEFNSNLNWLLHIHYTRKDFDLCRLIIEKQLKEYLNPEYIYFIRGQIEKIEGNYYAALQDFRRAIEINSKNVETLKEIGKTLYITGQIKQALEIFKEAEKIIKCPDHEISHYIGEILYKMAQFKTNPDDILTEMNDAKSYLQKAIMSGRKLESYQFLAKIFEFECEYVKAIDVLEICLQNAPDNKNVLSHIGILYLKLNEPDKAFSRLTEIMDNYGENSSNGLLAYGAILQSRNDIEEALAKYSQVSENYQNSPELWNNIGLCFLRKKKIVLAISCLKKSIWLSPFNYNCLYNLSLSYITAEQYASAFHCLAAAINIRKDNPDVYMLLGICLNKLGDIESAYLALEKSTLLPYTIKNPLVYLNFALFCYSTGKHYKSMENYNKFVEIFEDTPLPTEYKFYATKLKSLLQHIVSETQEKNDSKIQETTITSHELEIEESTVLK